MFEKEEKEIEIFWNEKKIFDKIKKKIKNKKKVDHNPELRMYQHFFQKKEEKEVPNDFHLFTKSHSTIKDSIHLLSNCVDFFIEHYLFFGEKIDFENVKSTFLLKSIKIKDEKGGKELNDWIRYKTHLFISTVQECYQEQTFDKIALLVEEYAKNVYHIYIKYNQHYILGKYGIRPQIYGLYTLYNVIKSVLLILAPIFPYFTESMNMKLFEVVDKPEVYNYTAWRKLEYYSIHLEKFVNSKPALFNVNDVSRIQNVQFMDTLILLVEEICNARRNYKIEDEKPLQSVSFLQREKDKYENENEYKDKKSFYYFINQYMEKKCTYLQDQCNLLEVNVEDFINNEKERNNIIQFNISTNPYLEELYEVQMLQNTFENMRKDANIHLWNPIHMLLCTSDEEYIKIVQKHLQNDLQKIKIVNIDDDITNIYGNIYIQKKYKNHQLFIVGEELENYKNNKDMYCEDDEDESYNEEYSM